MAHDDNKRLSILREFSVGKFGTSSVRTVNDLMQRRLVIRSSMTRHCFYHCFYHNATHSRQYFQLSDQFTVRPRDCRMQESVGHSDTGAGHYVSQSSASTLITAQERVLSGTNPSFLLYTVGSNDTYPDAIPIEWAVSQTCPSTTQSQYHSGLPRNVQHRVHYRHHILALYRHSMSAFPLDELCTSVLAPMIQ